MAGMGRSHYFGFDFTILDRIALYYYTKSRASDDEQDFFFFFFFLGLKCISLLRSTLQREM